MNEHHRPLTDTERLQGLRILLGYVQEGSSTSVKLFQDDATYDFIVNVGRKHYYGRTMLEALDAAIRHDTQEIT